MSIINKVAGGLANITTYNANTGAITAITVSGNITANAFYGDGGHLSNINANSIVGSYGNSNVANYLPTYTGNFTAGNANISGNILANYYLGNGAFLTGLYANANVAGYLPTYGGNIGANVITGNLFVGDGGGLSNIPYANVTGAYSNANVANYLPIYGGNLSANILTANGATFNGNVGITGNVTVSGNLNYTNVTDLVVGDPLIFLGANNTGNLVDLGIVGQYNDGSNLHTGLVRNHANGVWSFFTGLPTEPTTTIDWANAQPTPVSAGWFIGDGSNLSNINIANIAGSYANSNVANYLPTYTGTLSAGNANVTGNVTASYLLGNAAFVTGLPAGYSNTNAAAYLANSSTTGDIYGGNITGTGNVVGGNISTVGTVAATGNVSGGNITTSGNVTASYVIGNGSLLSDINISNIAGSYSNSNVASYLPTYTGNLVSLTGAVTTTANITGANLVTGGLVSATGNVSGANLVTGGLVNATGNITGSNIIGNGQFLSNINIGNIAGSYSNSNVANYLPTYSGNLSANIVTSNGANINGNVTITGNLAVSGNVDYTDVNNLNVGDPLIYIGANNVGNLVDLGIIGQYNDGSDLHTGLVRNHANGVWSFFTGLATEPTTVVDWANAQPTPVSAGWFIGDGSNLSNINIANIAGSYANSNVASYLPAANVAILGTTITATLFSGNGGELSNIQFGNLNGANANIAAYLPTYTGNLSPSNLSVTELSDFGAIGNITISGGSSGQFLTTDGTGNLSFGDPISAVPAIYFTANANANNQTFSNIYLSAFGANTDITLFYNGSLLENTYYSLSGSTLTVNTPLKVNDSICISQQFVSNANPVTMIPRSNDVITAATITPNVEYADQYDVLALAEALTVAAPTGVAQNAQRLTIRIKDNGVSQTLSWNAIYREIGTSLSGTTVAGKLLYVGCIYNSQDTTWDVVSVAIQA